MLALYKQYTKQIIIGSIVIALVLTSGGIYWWQKRKNRITIAPIMNNVTEQVSNDEQAATNTDETAKKNEQQDDSQFPIGTQVKTLYTEFEGVITYSGTVVNVYEETGKVLRLAKGYVHESNYTKVVDIHATETGWEYDEVETKPTDMVIRAVYTRDGLLMPLRQLDGAKEKLFSYQILDTISTDEAQWHNIHNDACHELPTHVLTFMEAQERSVYWCGRR